MVRLIRLRMLFYIWQMGWDKVGQGAGRQILHYFFLLLLFSNATQVLLVYCKIPGQQKSFQGF